MHSGLFEEKRIEPRRRISDSNTGYTLYYRAQGFSSRLPPSPPFLLPFFTTLPIYRHPSLFSAPPPILTVPPCSPHQSAFSLPHCMIFLALSYISMQCTSIGRKPATEQPERLGCPIGVVRRVHLTKVQAPAGIRLRGMFVKQPCYLESSFT